MAASLTEGVLGQFIGKWTITGKTRGRETTNGAQVQPQFNGAFVELHIKDPTGRSPYEARVFLGEGPDGSVIAHWLDGTGGTSSRTLGHGRVAGDVVHLRFAYPEGEMRNRLEYDRARDRWRLYIEMGPEDQPKVFSDWYFDRVKAR